MPNEVAAAVVVAGGLLGASAIFARTFWNAIHGGDMHFEGSARVYIRDNELIKAMKEQTREIQKLQKANRD